MALWCCARQYSKCRARGRCSIAATRERRRGLPQRMRAVHSAMNQADATGDLKRAHRLLEDLASGGRSPTIPAPHLRYAKGWSRTAQLTSPLWSRIPPRRLFAVDLGRDPLSDTGYRQSPKLACWLGWIHREPVALREHPVRHKIFQCGILMLLWLGVFRALWRRHESRRDACCWRHSAAPRCAVPEEYQP
jgi:hypothetical protein